MFFELNGKTYRIKFYRTGKTTVAELQEVSSHKGGEPFISLGAYGFASTYYKDTFNKSTGRKVALTHLLELLSHEAVDDADTGSPLNPPLTKEDRVMIWAKYFETHKK